MFEFVSCRLVLLRFVDYKLEKNTPISFDSCLDKPFLKLKFMPRVCIYLSVPEKEKQKERYIYIYIHMYETERERDIYIYIHVYVSKKREKERERQQSRAQRSMS